MGHLCLTLLSVLLKCQIQNRETCCQRYIISIYWLEPKSLLLLIAAADDVNSLQTIAMEFCTKITSPGFTRPLPCFTRPLPCFTKDNITLIQTVTLHYFTAKLKWINFVKASRCEKLTAGLTNHTL